MKLNLAFIGFGTVGQGLTEILDKKKKFLKTKHNFEYNIVAVCDKNLGSIYNKNGLAPQKLLSIINSTNNLNEYKNCIKGFDSFKTIKETNADVIIELTYTNLTTGEPALSHIKTALENKKHVITSNKGPYVIYHKKLKKLALQNNVSYKIEGTVMSGTPVINTALKSLAGCNISKIKGILNGTTNYILSQMEHGKEYKDALPDSIQLGYAEADPTGDVEGWDALAKVIILANVIMDVKISTEDIDRTGITNIKLSDIESAKLEGYRWKLIGEIEKSNNEIIAKVKPQKLSLTDNLANVMGNTNAITFDTDLLGPITIIGPGAGKIETGFSILNDLLDINYYYSN